VLTVNFFVFQFVSPKVHRLLQVLKEYKPISTNETQHQTNKYNNDRRVIYIVTKHLYQSFMNILFTALA